MNILVRWGAMVWFVALLAGQHQAMAQPAPAQASVNAWLMRLHEASRKRAYTGTFVV